MQAAVGTPGVRGYRGKNAMTATKLFSGLVLAGCIPYAQAQAPQPPPPIQLRVVALDSRNQPVSDLNADDLQITDQNRAQKIISFRKAGGGGDTGHPGEFTNKRATGGQTTVVLLDLLNQDRIDGLESSRKIGRALAQISGDSLYMYIVALDGSLFPIHPMPAPGAAAGDAAWTKNADDQIQTALKTVNKARKAGMTMEDKVKKTYVNLETTAKDLSAFPGARSIVWVTDGIPQVYQEKNCSGDWFGDCALYVPHMSVHLAAADTTVYILSYTGSPDPNTVRDNDYLASSTGGRTFMNADLGDVLSQIRADEQNTYLVAYQPGPENWDQKFHKIKASCGKGLKVQTRTRYYAIPMAAGGEGGETAQKAAPATDEDSAILAVLESPKDVPDIGLHVSVSPAAGKPGALHFQIRIDPADLKLQEKAGAFDDQIGMALADYTATGLKGLPVPTELTVHMTPERHATAMKEGISFGMDHAMDNTVRYVRFIVFDHASNAYGSLAIPVSLPGAPAAK